MCHLSYNNNLVTSAELSSFSKSIWQKQENIIYGTFKHNKIFLKFVAWKVWRVILYVCILNSNKKWKMYHIYGHWSLMEMSCFLATNILFSMSLLYMFVLTEVGWYSDHEAKCVSILTKSISHLPWLTNISSSDDYFPT